jgi:hypothetical protein
MKYQLEYGLEYTAFNVEKDIADCVSAHGPKNTKLFITPFLKETAKLIKPNTNGDSKIK